MVTWKGCCPPIRVLLGSQAWGRAAGRMGDIVERKHVLRCKLHFRAHSPCPQAPQRMGEQGPSLPCPPCSQRNHRGGDDHSLKQLPPQPPHLVTLKGNLPKRKESSVQSKGPALCPGRLRRDLAPPAVWLLQGAHSPQPGSHRSPGLNLWLKWPHRQALAATSLFSGKAVLSSREGLSGRPGSPGCHPLCRERRA